jgi:hypothetical protein
MCTYTGWGILVMPAASLVDKGKPDVSRGRKATGPTRSAGLPKREDIMRKSTKLLGAVAAAGD